MIINDFVLPNEKDVAPWKYCNLRKLHQYPYEQVSDFLVCLFIYVLLQKNNFHL